MNPWRLLLALVIFLAASISAPAHAEMSVCVLPDGSDLYTNNAKDYEACEPYEPKSEVPVVSTSGRDGPRTAELHPSEPAVFRIEESLPSGEMPFDIYRMLSIGMYEPEVLSRAGLPTVIKSYPGAGGVAGAVATSFRYFYMGDWIVVITFGPSGRIVELQRFRARP
jgi:hypothetical protein